MYTAPFAVPMPDVNQNQKDSSRQQCSGMYSQKSWGGSTPPFILFTAIKEILEDDSDPIISLVIFEWRDEYLFGAYPTPDSTEVGNSQFDM